MAVRQTAEITITDLSDAANVDLSSYAYVFSADKDGKATAGSCTFSASAFIGATQVDCSIDNNAITKPSAGVTTSVTKATGSMSPVVTVTVTNSLTQTVLNGGSTVSVPITYTYQGETVTVWKDFCLALAKTGATGAVAYNYFLSVTPDAVVRAENGTLTPTSVSCLCTRAQTGNPAAYAAWYWAHYTTNGSTWTEISKSSSASTAGTAVVVNIPTDVSGIKAIKVSAHTASPTAANQVDVQTIPIIDAGATGPQGEPAYTVLLTNESHTFAANKDGKPVAATSVDTVVRAYKGATQVAATIGTVTGTISGKLTATIKSGTNSTTNATLTVAVTTTLDTQQGTLSIPITVDGKSFTKVFSWSLARTGATGAQGPQGNPGEDGLSMSITTDNGNILKNNSGSTTLTAHVWQAGAEVTGSALTALGTLKWYKDGGTTAVATGATITVSASDVASKAVYHVQLEG